MLLQNNDELLDIISSVGCYFLALGRIIELETGYEFRAEDINEVWKNGKAHKYISINNNIINPDKILKGFAYFTKKPHLTVCQIAEEKNNKVVYWSWTKPLYQDAKYLIEMVLTEGTEGTHFRLLDNSKSIIFDSYSFNKYSCIPSGRFLHYMVIK